MVKELFDCNKEYGIVLEGGGAKGAYQIGAWKAFLECGINIKGVAGVSVGALNGALICMGDYEKAVDLWRNISYSRIMSVDDLQMDKLIRGKFKELDLQQVSKQGKQFFEDRGFDVAPLRQLVEENIDEKKIKKSNIEFYMGTFSISNLKEMEISAKEAEEGFLKDYLLASANFPLFKNEKLNGMKFLDGGIINNVPIDMLINRGYKNIIVVRIFGIGIEKKVKIPEDVNVIYIAPRCELCNILEFNKKKATRNITLGYYDAMKVLKSLCGRDYYIQSQRSEVEYLEAMLTLDEDARRKLLQRFKKENITNTSPVRILTEEVYPLLAASFKLGKSWEYGDLYYAILEYIAKKFRIPKFKIYSEFEFLNLLENKLSERNPTEEKDDFLFGMALSILHSSRFILDKCIELE